MINAVNPYFFQQEKNTVSSEFSSLSLSTSTSINTTPAITTTAVSERININVNMHLQKFTLQILLD